MSQPQPPDGASTPQPFTAFSTQQPPPVSPTPAGPPPQPSWQQPAVAERVVDVIPDAPERRGHLRPGTSGLKQWEICYEILRDAQPGQSIHWEIFGQELGVDATDHRERAKINQAVRRAIKELEDRDKRTARNVRGYGYEIVRDEQRLVLARKHQQRAVKEVNLARRQVTTVDLGAMESSTRKAFELTGMALQHQAMVIGRMDIRQKDLEDAVAQVQTEQRLNAEQLAETQARLAALEARMNGGASGSALPPSSQAGYGPTGWTQQQPQQLPASGYPQQG